MSFLTKRPITSLFTLAVVAGGASLIHPAVQGYVGDLFAPPAAATPAAQAPQAMPVPVEKVAKRTLPVYLDYPARTEAIQSVSLQAKVTGYLRERVVADGADVKAGDVLYVIDDRDAQTALDQARAQLQRDTAQVDYLRSSLQRGEELSQKGFLAKDGFDQRTSSLRQAEAGIAIDKAAVAAAELDIERSTIRAPFAGRLSRGAASVGTLVTSGQTVLNTLVQLDPIYVTFNPAEKELSAIKAALEKGEVTAEITLPGQEGSQEGSKAYAGKLTFIDNRLDASTGTVAARATIANGKFDLLPGQYVHLRLSVGEQPDVLMAPQVALGSSQLGKYVYVIGKEGTVEQRMVETGRTDGPDIAILSGLNENDLVISGNLQKIWPGVPVQPLPEKENLASR
ncbi:efflux RND transporter periplasmic adaptor subunit [Pleomorphomonas sp. JP5]|uniref:efflux RND transporter periplasmic adaptor subunit n=1 Tax=Pleomorphomonas sp. JP5 TaxID=2942998 RepID=UPI002044361A|nr:efflux RND transporter periplasmic adaptor subunit [Pleomorphomonas sp. JP5]MCM5557415.1 efflux RND transporter periplasmic adaptor subunit [Pleomorphomonas sp. JP5]